MVTDQISLMYHITVSLITVQNVCLCASHTHSVSRLCNPSKPFGSMLWIWLLWRCLEKKINQILSHQIISKQAAVSKSRSKVLKKKKKKARTEQANEKPHLQDNEGREVGEGIVWNVCDLVEGQRHGLQGRQGVECRHWDFC